MTEYQKFQLQWMIDHNHSIDELIDELDRCQYDWADDNESIKSIFNAWEYDIGFGGELWPCEDEWKHSEDSEEKIDYRLADALDECDAVVLNIEGLGKSKHLYKTNKLFRKEVAEKFNYYWFKYLNEGGDVKFECVLDALSSTYDAWRLENKIND